MRGSGPDVELAASLLGDRAGESSSSGSGSGSGKDGSGRDGSGRDAPVARLWGVPLRMSDRHLAYFLGVGSDELETGQERRLALREEGACVFVLLRFVFDALFVCCYS